MTTYNTGNPLGSASAKDLFDNAENLDVALNSNDDTFVDRLGNVRPTYKGAVDPTGLAQSAAQSATEAASARDVAFVAADVYLDIVAGIANTTDEQQFQVVAGDEVIRYLNDAGSAVELVRYPSSASVRKIYESSQDLFRVDDLDLFKESNLTVRRYTSESHITEYTAGYSQNATPDGLLVSIPVSGSSNNKFYLRTGRKLFTESVTANFAITEIAYSSDVIGIGYINGFGDYVGYGFSSSGVVRKTIGFNATNLSPIIKTYSVGDVVSLKANRDRVEIFVNDLLVYTIVLDDGEFDGELLIYQAGFPSYIASFRYEGDPIRRYVEQVSSQTLPEGFYQFDGASEFSVYTKISGAVYVGFKIKHRLDMNDLVYVDYWRIIEAYFYLHDGMNLVNTGVFALAQGESECVWKRNSNKDDFTGGYHGDEILSDVSFYADGVQLNVSDPIPLTPCGEFYYLIKSTMHATAEGGVVVPGHPIECYHIKKTSFKDAGYETFNRLIWETPGPVTLWYHGISCVAKPAAMNGYTEADFVPVLFTGTQEQKLESVGNREFISWGVDYSASVTAKQILPAEDDAASTLFISDRVEDSKYYRRSPPKNVSQGEVWESLMNVKFGARKE